MAKAKIKEQPQRLPLPLSFVEGDTFVRCVTSREVDKIRERFQDSDGNVISSWECLKGMAETLIVDEDGGRVFEDGGIGNLWDPWQKEVVGAFADVYTPTQKKDSPPVSTSPASSPSTPAAEPSKTPSDGSASSTS